MIETTNPAFISTPQRNDFAAVSRRAMIGGAALAGTAMLMPRAAMAATGEWRLAFRNVHNGETFDAVFARGGQLVPQGLAELNHGLRDWRVNETIEMDRTLLALVMKLRDSLGVAGGHQIELISGYRSPHTNAALRAEGGADTGVAKKSQHMLGKATDLNIPGVHLDHLRTAALALHGGGVGYYPKDNFVHVDTGRVRHW